MFTICLPVCLLVWVSLCLWPSVIQPYFLYCLVNQIKCNPILCFFLIYFYLLFILFILILSYPPLYNSLCQPTTKDFESSTFFNLPQGGLSAYIGIIQNASLDFQPIDGLHRLHHKAPTVWCYYVFPTLKGILNAALSFWPIHGWKNAQPSESLRQRTAWQQETWSLCSRCWLTMTEKTIELGFGPSFQFFW